MKRFLYITLITSVIVFFIPLFVVMIMGGVVDNSARDNDLIKVYFTEENTVKEINTSEYLTGVVCAELPSSFHDEVLKAQAVAARTYMNYKIVNGIKHENGAMVCTDYKHCQAWRDVSESDETFINRIRKAITDTAGEMVLYNNKPINSVFFSTSSGKTENCSDVWGEEVPYLVSVVSQGEEAAPNFMSECIITADEAKKKISEQIEGVDFSKGLFQNIIRSESGGIKTLDIGGVNIKGTKLRSIFELRSTNADIKEENGNIIFTVKGNGHGVGMSQYGAEAMAQNGKGYKDILAHYYTGCTVK